MRCYIQRDASYVCKNTKRKRSGFVAVTFMRTILFIHTRFLRAESYRAGTMCELRKSIISNHIDSAEGAVTTKVSNEKR